MGYYYTEQGYALVAGDFKSPHHFGGEPYHQGAICPVCDIPLLLLADIDCVAFRKLEPKKLFQELDRLPLYYCWKCCAEKLSYQISKKSIKIFRNEGEPQGDDFPYAGFPASFKKRPIKIRPIPYETAKLLAVGQEVDRYWLKESDLSAIEEGLKPLRHSGFSRSSFNRHQIGGLLNLIQGHEYIVCPNTRCKYHIMATKEHRPVRMLELAVIHDDPHSGLPMFESAKEFSETGDFNEFSQVVYWVCEECLTITTSNRCD